MMTMAKAPARRTLAQEIEKLEGILEGLDATVRFVVADALQQAVERTLATAASQAAHQAVQLVLAHPDLQAQLCNTLSPKPIASFPMPIAATSADGTRASACDRCCRLMHQAVNVVSEAAGACLRIGQRHPRVALAICAIVIMPMMAVCWWGPWLGILAGWVGGLLTAWASQPSDSLRCQGKTNLASDGNSTASIVGHQSPVQSPPGAGDIRR